MRALFKLGGGGVRLADSGGSSADCWPNDSDGKYHAAKRMTRGQPVLRKASLRFVTWLPLGRDKATSHPRRCRI